jgi:hypothetical protein
MNIDRAATYGHNVSLCSKNAATVFRTRKGRVSSTNKLDAHKVRARGGVVLMAYHRKFFWSPFFFFSLSQISRKLCPPRTFRNVGLRHKNNGRSFTCSCTYFTVDDCDSVSSKTNRPTCRADQRRWERFSMYRKPLPGANIAPWCTVVDPKEITLCSTKRKTSSTVTRVHAPL